MAWKALLPAEALAKFTASEVTLLQGVQGSTAGLANSLTVVINEWVATLNAANYPVVLNSNQVPDQLRRHIVAAAIWAWLRDFPKLAIFKTDDRKNAASDAEKVLEKIAARTYGAIESPYGTDQTTANWNSLQKVVGRMSPIPPAQQQLQQVPNPIYVNPNAPSDTVPSNSPGMPQIPVGFQAFPAPGKVALMWDTVNVATSYNLYRALATGQEALFVSGITGTNYVDNGLTNGTTYYYKLTSVNSAGESQPTVELQATPLATELP